MSQSSITTGQDAFLDIVANLVGILIILIVIVGAHAGAAARIHQAVLQSDRQERALKKLEIDNEQLETLIDQEKEFTRQLTDVRHQRLVELETVRQLVKKQTKDLDQKEREAFLAKTDQQELQQELTDLEETLAALNSAAAATPLSNTKTETIEHFPNPIARTVFSKEVHFRLLGGKLVWVPLDELVDTMKQHWRLIAENKSFQKTKQTVSRLIKALESLWIGRCSLPSRSGRLDWDCTLQKPRLCRFGFIQRATKNIPKSKSGCMITVIRWPAGRWSMGV